MDPIRRLFGFHIQMLIWFNSGYYLDYKKFVGVVPTRKNSNADRVLTVSVLYAAQVIIYTYLKPACFSETSQKAVYIYNSSLCFYNINIVIYE